MKPADQPISHSKYLGSSASEGYPGGDEYATAVPRRIYGSYPASSELSDAADFDRRVITSKIMGVPDTSVYSPRDKVVLSGTEPEEDRTFFVSEGVRNFDEGPYGQKPSWDAKAFGEIVIEKVTG